MYLIENHDGHSLSV